MRLWQRTNGRKDETITLMIVPMIDVIFLLLLFFVISTSFEAGTRVRLQLPGPPESRALPSNFAKSIVVNCEYGEDGGARYRIGADPPQGLDAIGERLEAAQVGGGDLSVIIRADRRLAFVDVRRVMERVAAARVPMMKVSVLRDGGF